MTQNGTVKSHIPHSKAGKLPSDGKEALVHLQPDALAEIRRVQDAFYETLLPLDRMAILGELIPTAASGIDNVQSIAETKGREMEIVYHRHGLSDDTFNQDREAIVNTARTIMEAQTHDIVAHLRENMPSAHADRASRNGTGNGHGAKR